MTKKPMSSFWQKWLTAWCAAVGLFGVILAGGALESTSAPIRTIFSILNGPGQLDLNPHMQFSLAILGAVTFGWSLTLMAAIQAANLLEKQASRPIWIWITVSLVSWYIIDSLLSIATGFWLNAVSNTIFLATFLIPILRSKVLSPVEFAASYR
jgi:hypothetical protein